MSLSRLCLAFAVSVAVVGAAKADVLAAGPMFASPSQNQVICYVHNAGVRPVVLRSVDIFDQAGNIVPLTENGSTSTCPPNVILFGNRGCNIFYAPPIGFEVQAFVCKVVTSPQDSAENLRGTLDLRENNVTLQVVPLQ